MAKQSETPESELITSDIVNRATAGSLTQVKDIVDVQASINADDIADLAVAAFESRLEQREDELKLQRNELQQQHHQKHVELRELCHNQGAVVAERFVKEVEKAVKKADVKKVTHQHSCEAKSFENGMLNVGVTFYVVPLNQSASESTFTLHKQFKPTTGRVGKLIEETGALLEEISQVEDALNHIKSKAQTGKERIRRTSKLTITAQRIAASGPDGQKLLEQILSAGGRDNVVKSLLGEE